MRKVVKYEDRYGGFWDTEKEAIDAEAKAMVKSSLEAYMSDYKINISNWILNAKNNKEVIGALLYLLEIDDTKLAVDRIMRKK